MLRISAGASILGSKNSIWEGPPDREKQHDRLVLDGPPGGRGLRHLPCQQMWQRQSAEEAEAADLEEITSRITLAGTVRFAIDF